MTSAPPASKSARSVKRRPRISGTNREPRFAARRSRDPVQHHSGRALRRLRITGQSDNLRAPALFLYRDWLPQSGEKLRDYPLFCQRLTLFPDVPETDTVTELFLPLQ
ncbi:GyrI-like domain-containing protein [Altericroceibacterium spongiae]|uniref:GyrI-like domain-containing protein n=1 Tax=Altericroceibacterium spongiae TaxID=2320269 RepID=UPI003082999C